MTGMTLLTDRAGAHRVGRAEFERFREERHDGLRYELLAGEILVTPAPAPLHQHVLRRLMHLLESGIPEGTAMLQAPVDLVLTVGDGDTVVQPDLLVAPWADPSTKAALGPAALVVEVLSPTTWHRDLGSKMAAYATNGVPHYWVVAPQTPSLTVYALAPDGAYAEEAHVEGEGVARISEPFELDVSPMGLVR